MRLLSPKLLLVGALLVLSGCVEELQHDLPEQDANDIMALLIDKGIGARKTKEEQGNEPRYMISVPRQDYATSVRLLREYSLPRPLAGGFGDFRKGKGMIPTQTEERAMWYEAVSGEIANALNKVDGVLEARVIVALPEQTDLTQPDQKPKASASVFVKYRPDTEGKPPLSEDKVKQFVVSGSTVEIDPKNVSVILTTPTVNEEGQDPKTRMQEVLGLTMTASSASTFKMMMGAVSLMIVAMAGLLTWTFLRGGGQSSPRRARNQA